MKKDIIQSYDIKRVNILGVGVSAINIQQALASIEKWILYRDQHYVWQF